MAANPTGNQILGTSLLDLLSTDARREVGTFGHTGCNALVRFYDNDDPIGRGYQIGLSNNAFLINKLSNMSDTLIGIGTDRPVITRGLDIGYDLNIGGNLLKGGLPYVSSQWTDSNVDSSNLLYYTGPVSIGTSNYPSGLSTNLALNVGGSINFTGSLLQNGVEFVSGGGGGGTTVTVLNNISTSNNFAAYNLYGGTTTRTVLTNAPTLDARTLYKFELTVGRYIINATLPFTNDDGLVLGDNYQWVKLGLYRDEALAADAGAAPVIFTSMRINSSTEVITQPLSFIVEVVTTGMYTMLVTGSGHTLTFGSADYDSRLRVVPIVAASGLSDTQNVRAALQVTPLKSIFTVEGGARSVFDLETSGYFMAATSNVNVHLNGTKYAYIDDMHKDYSLDITYTYDGASAVQSTRFTVTLAESAEPGDVVDIAVYPTATADTLYAAGYLFQKIDVHPTPWNTVAGGGIRYHNRVVIDGDLIVQGSIIGGSNAGDYTMTSRYDVTDVTGRGGAGIAVEWAPCFPAPYLLPGLGGGWTTTCNVAAQRYAGNEVVVNLFTSGVVTQVPTVLGNDYVLTVPYKIKSELYANGQVVGDLLVTVKRGAQQNTFKAFGRIDLSRNDGILLRYLTGTTEASVGALSAGTEVSVSGTIVFCTPQMTGGVPADFLPPEFRQDLEGRVGVNVGAAAVRAQLDVIGKGTEPTLIVDAQGTGNSFEARTLGMPKMVVAANGNVGIGTTNPLKPFHMEGDMMLTGMIYDSNMATLWVPGSTLKWLPTLTPPVLTVPTAGVITYTRQQGSYRYIGNEVVYNVNMAGTVTTQQTNPLLDMTLNLPYPTAAANYPVATIMGELWLNTVSVDGASSNAFKAYGRCAGGVDSSSVTVRFLSGTTDASFGVLTSGTQLTLQGQLTYNTPLIANANGVPPNYIPAPITQDQMGKIGINMGGNTPTAALHVVGSSNAVPALVVNQTAVSGDIVRVERSGVSRMVVDGSGNVGVGTGAPLKKLHVVGDATIGEYPGYVNKLVPVSSGRVNGVNITALNARTRTSRASAEAAVSSWTARSAVDNGYRSVCWAPELSLFVAVAQSGIGNRVSTSADGISWTTRISAVDNNWRSVCWAPEISLFVAVAQSGAFDRVMTSPDGINWTSRSTPTDNNIGCVIWAPELSLFVAVCWTGTGNRVMTSHDGIAWTARTSAADNTWASVVWSPELAMFVATADSGTNDRVMTSRNGVDWTARTPAAVNGWRSVCWAPDLSIFVAVANSGIGNRVMTSTDGITWTIRTSAVDNNWNSVVWAPQLSIFVAVAGTGSNSVMTSPDGINWTARTSAADNVWQCVTWSPELSIFVAVGETGAGNRVMTSAIALPAPQSTILVSPPDARRLRGDWMPPVKKMFAMPGGKAATYLDVSLGGNTSAKGFQGGFTDGRYAYLVPYSNGSGYSGLFTRVDLLNYTTSGVTYLDVSTAGNTGAKGLRGGFTDGRYAYLVPEYNGVHNGIFTRVDLSNFTTSGVSYLDVSTAGNTGAKGFVGGFTDGRYAYLVPFSNGVVHGIFTRVDLNNFTTSGVSYLDVSTAGNTGAKGFHSGFTDGRYAYLVPHNNGVYHGIFTRVDLTNYTISGVTYLDVSTAGNTGAKGFVGGFTDGRYAYLVPNNNGAYHGIFTRVDLSNYATSGVSYLDVSTAGNTGAKGFFGGFTDGRYAYLVPHYNGSHHGIFTRVDLLNYTTSGVSYLDVSTAGETGAKGFVGGFTDGRYAYLVPYNNGVFNGIFTKVLITDVFLQGF